MLSRRARGAALSGALALLLLILPAQAMAIEPSSQITTPAGPTTYLFNESGSKLKISGTAEGITEVSIRCYSTPTLYGPVLAGNVKVPTGPSTSTRAPISSARCGPGCRLFSTPTSNSSTPSRAMSSGAAAIE